LDYDGDLDAFMAVSPGNRVWLNDGAGVFTDSGQSLGTAHHWSVSLGDVDGDGDMDAVTGDILGSNKVWMNDGTGVFSDSGQNVGSSSRGLALGDLDSDGDLDVFVTMGWDQAQPVEADQVWLNNTSPTANADGPYSVEEGSTIMLSGTGSDPDDDVLTFTWDLDNDSIFETPGQSVTFSAAELDGPSSQTVVLQVCDTTDACDTDSTTVNIANADPEIVTVTNDGPIGEGSTATVTVTATDPARANDPLSFEFDCDNYSSYEIGPQSGAAASCAFADNGDYQVNVRVTDDDGGEASGATTVTMNNVAPTVGTITAPLEPVQVDTAINTSADFTDPGLLDTHTAIWDWGDDNTSAGTVIETDGSGSVTGSHAYATPGVYTIKLAVTDKDDDSGESIFQYIVVYDPDGGFVTGGGWIWSEAGYCKLTAACDGAEGKANFGFVSKYKKGAHVPTGETEFQFKAGNLNFHSDSYQWLVVAGPKAMYKGEGKINGAGNYGFMISAVDEKLTPSTDTDLFRIKIWEGDDGDTVVYDNQMGEADDADPTTEIGGGNIVIHKEK
jgi:hypothetical protein